MLNDLEFLCNLVPQSTFYFFTSRETRSLSLCLFKTHPRTGTPPPPRGLRRPPIIQGNDSGWIRILQLSLPQSKNENIRAHIHGGALRDCVGVLIMAGSPSPMSICFMLLVGQIFNSRHTSSPCEMKSNRHSGEKPCFCFSYFIMFFFFMKMILCLGGGGSSGE